MPQEQSVSAHKSITYDHDELPQGSMSFTA